MELQEEDALPRGSERGFWVGRSPRGRADGGDLLGGDQGQLGLPVEFLDPRFGGVAAYGVMLQVALNFGQAGIGFADLGEVAVGRAVEQRRGAGLGLDFPDRADVLFGGSPAVVARAIERHHGRRGLLQADRAGDAPADRALVVIAEGNAVGERAAAVWSHPPEEIGRQVLFVGHGAHEDVVLHALERQDLGQGGRVPEGVGVVGHPRRPAQQAPEGQLAVKPLAHQGLAARDIYVRLHPPAAHHAPAALRHALADLGEHAGVVALHPLVELRGAGGEGEVRRFVHAVEGRAEGAVNYRQPLGPRPEPDGIDVRLSDHVNAVLRRLGRPRRRPLGGQPERDPKGQRQSNARDRLHGMPSTPFRRPILARGGRRRSVGRPSLPNRPNQARAATLLAYNGYG